MLQTPSMTFHIVEDAVVILSSKGVFKQSNIYVRKNYIYAKHGSGFIRLQRHEKGLQLRLFIMTICTFPLPRNMTTLAG